MFDIRRVQESDIVGFHRLLDEVCRERRYLGALEGPSLERVEAFVRTNVRDGLPQFMAHHADTIVGWCDAIPGDASAGAAHIGRLGMGVAREYRRRGIGRKLIDATVAAARAMGLEKIELSVYSSNDAAITLYRSLGFTEEGRKLRGRLIDERYDDVVLMALMLKEPNQAPEPAPTSVTRPAFAGGAPAAARLLFEDPPFNRASL